MQAAQSEAAPKPELVLLCAIASVMLVLHIVSGNGYGFHRDELQTLDDARHLAAGFVAYPPLTPLAGRLFIALFGISPQVFRLPAVIVNGITVVIVGLIARELGGRRLAQALAALMCLPIAIVFSTMLQYNTFDYLAWALAAFFTARLLRTGHPGNWIGVGAALGLGVLSKYSIAFLALTIIGGVIALPSQRHHLRTRWFWLGVLTTVLIASPNLIWLASHHFITLRMEHAIHARDIRIGRAKGFFTDQPKFCLVALPLIVAGLVSLLRSPRFRLLALFFLAPLVLFALARGRSYYLLPAYLPLYAAAAVAFERWISHRRHALRLSVTVLVCLALLADTVALSLPYVQLGAPGTALFRWQIRQNEDIPDEIGWPEFAAQVAAAYNRLSPTERDHIAILAENYGEAGALELYGPEYHLPSVISQVNSFHDRGFGPYPPENVLVTGGNYHDLAPYFESCRLAGQVHIPYGVQNEEARRHPDLFLCHHLREPWDVLWARERHFG